MKPAFVFGIDRCSFYTC